MSMLRRRGLRANAGSSTTILPSEYQQVEWIQVNAKGAYINTLLIPTTANKVRIKGKYYKSAYNGREEVIVHGYQTGSTRIEVGFSTTQNRFICYSGNSSAAIVDSRIYGTPTVFDATVKFDYPQSKSIELNIEGTILTGVSNTENAKPTEPFIICDPSNFFFDGRVYGVSFEFDDVEVGNFVPCYRKSDGEIGMYDTVSQAFFTNAGSSSFSKGADV